VLIEDKASGTQLIQLKYAHTRRPLRFDLQVVGDVCDLLYAPDQRYREPPPSVLIEANFDQEAIDARFDRFAWLGYKYRRARLPSSGRKWRAGNRLLNLSRRANSARQ
jgi:hypothetical protein